ncbi:MAG: Mur ligase [Fibrobacter sp.]|jgi:UDP-N-acetylmuramate--alanine ligase|nr:Mur ligase [Fibrobacter sp.]
MNPVHNQTNSFYFIGLAGVGMSAIAQYLNGKSFKTGGSDRVFNKNSPPLIQKQLEALGIECFLQDASGLKNYSCVVVSSAIEDTNKDLIEAKKMGLSIYHRSEILSYISETTKTIAVSGTSGKSTVTAMIYHILDYANLFPSLITGAPLVSLEKKGEIGNAVSNFGEWLVIEADESDGTLARYAPDIGLILNIEKDHKETPELLEIFKSFADNIKKKKGILIVNDANDHAKSLSMGRHLDFGNENHIAVQGTDLRVHGHKISFRVRYQASLVRFELNMPGKHNMENALAASTVALQIGVPIELISEALSSFSGIDRRHQVLGVFSGVTLMDDFAHNPAKIEASLKSVQAFTEGRVIAYFQPHGYGPTRFLRQDFVSTFNKTLRKASTDIENDCVFFSEIYYAGGTAKKDVSSADLVDDLLELGVEAYFFEDRKDAALKMVEMAKAEDTILLMGARDPSLSSFAKEVQGLLENKSKNKV